MWKESNWRIIRQTTHSSVLLTAVKAKYTFDFSEEEGDDDGDEEQENDAPASPVQSYKDNFAPTQNNNDDEEDDDDDIFPPKPTLTS